MGTVFRNSGKYLKYSERITHTGSHRSVEWVDDLQDATVFHMLPQWIRRLDLLRDAEELEVIQTISLAGEKL